MALKVDISPRAAREIRRADTWWATNRPAAPGAITAEFEDAVSLLAEHPGIGVPYDGARTRGVRRLYLSTVGYFLYYRSDGTSLYILAFWHAKRMSQPRLQDEAVSPA